MKTKYSIYSCQVDRNIIRNNANLLLCRCYQAAPRWLKINTAALRLHEQIKCVMLESTENAQLTLASWLWFRLTEKVRGSRQKKPFRIQDSKESWFCWVVSSEWGSNKQMQSGVNRLGCKVWPCPGCRLDPICSQHSVQVLMFWNGCWQPLVTSEGSRGGE